jgi:hypothetical protein
LLEGKGRYVRHIKVHDTAEIDQRVFAALLGHAAGSRKKRRTSPSKKARSSVKRHRR